MKLQRWNDDSARGPDLVSSVADALPVALLSGDLIRPSTLTLNKNPTAKKYFASEQITEHD